MQTGLLPEMASEAEPDRIAIGPAAAGLSFSAMLGLARSGAAWIAGQPVGNVACAGVSSPAFAVSLLASGMAGRLYAPLSCRLPDPDLSAEFV